MAESGDVAGAALIIDMSTQSPDDGRIDPAVAEIGDAPNGVGMETTATRTFSATWLVNVTGADGLERPAYCRIGEDSAYRPDDTFVIGWVDEVEANRIDDVPEMMWARHNADSRPSGETCRSMCMGDVVVVNERAYACEDMGFRALDERPSDVREGTYVEYVQANR